MLDAHKQPLCLDLELGEAGRTGETTFPRPGLRTPQTACAEDPAGLSALGLLHLSVCRHLWRHRPRLANPLLGRGTLRSLGAFGCMPLALVFPDAHRCLVRVL